MINKIKAKHNHECWGATQKIRMNPRTRVREREFLARSSTQLECGVTVIPSADSTNSKKF
jgi:hypothetical protein